jgi:hypothetical protein
MAATSLYGRQVYDKALNAEFAYPAGECEIGAGPGVRCTVWKMKLAAQRHAS